MILMGTGTSHGVPVIGCSCNVCRSSDEKDMRLRASAYIFEPFHAVIDVGPEFRIQALKYGVKKPDAVFLTHSHADHLHGIDDLRIFCHSVAPTSPLYDRNLEMKKTGIPVYSLKNTVDDIKMRFSYIFTPTREGGGKPKLDVFDIMERVKNEKLVFGAVDVNPVVIGHGSLDDMGLVFTETKDDGTQKSIAYLTDCNYISNDSLAFIREKAGVLEHLVIDGLRIRPHSTHFCFEQALEVADCLDARNVSLTHLTHDLSFRQVSEFTEAVLGKYPNLKKNKSLGGHFGPGFDGQVIEI